LAEDRLVEAILAAVGGGDRLDVDVLRTAGRLQPRQRRLDRVAGSSLGMTKFTLTAMNTISTS